MGASSVHRSPSFCFCVITVGTMLSVINRTISFYPLYLALHVLSYFATSSLKQFQQACPQLRVNELEAWQRRRIIHIWPWNHICSYSCFSSPRSFACKPITAGGVANAMEDLAEFLSSKLKNWQSQFWQGDRKVEICSCSCRFAAMWCNITKLNRMIMIQRHQHIRNILRCWRKFFIHRQLWISA